MNYETLTADEILAALNLLPDVVIEQIKREDVVLAGGLIRDIVTGVPPKDIDIFCHSRAQAERLALEASPFVRQSLFAFSVSIGGLPVQYVFYKEFTDDWELISQFDFRACCAGVSWKNGWWVGIAVEGFHEDCRTKILRFMSQTKDAGKLTALGRALNLAKKGWTLSTNEAAKILTHFEPEFTNERVTYAFRPGYGGTR